MASPEPVALSDTVYYLPGAVNTVIVAGSGNRAVIVDSGQDRNYGKTLKRGLEHLDLRPVAIVNTHAHADHFGGNAYLLKHYQIPVYAPAFEASLMRDPYLEPVYLFHGARPLDELRGKWLQAPPSPVDHLLGEGVLELAGVRLEAIATPGHAHRHVSLLVDDVLIAADAVFGQALLERYPLPFGQDVAAQIASLDTVAGVAATWVLPGHGAPSQAVTELVAANRAAIERASAAVLAACRGTSGEEILAATCQALAIDLADLPRYHLSYCTVSAHLSYLRARGAVEPVLKANRLLWRRL